MILLSNVYQKLLIKKYFMIQNSYNIQTLRCLYDAKDII